MKELPLSEPLLLVLVGYPGSGKSHFARELSSRYNFSVISGDRIRSIIFSQPAFSRQDEDTIKDVALYQLEELFKTKRPVIFDADGTTKQARLHLAKLAKDANYRMLTIWVQTDAETAFIRSSRRSQSKVGDKYTVNLSRELFEQLCKQFTAPSGNEHYLVISGKHTYATQVQTLLRKLKILTEAPKAKSVPISAPRPTQPVYGDVTTSRNEEPKRPKINFSRRIKLR